MGILNGRVPSSGKYEWRLESESEKQLHLMKQASVFSRQLPDVVPKGVPDVSALVHPEHMRKVKVDGSGFP